MMTSNGISARTTSRSPAPAQQHRAAQHPLLLPGQRHEALPHHRGVQHPSRAVARAHNNIAQPSTRSSPPASATSPSPTTAVFSTPPPPRPRRSRQPERHEPVPRHRGVQHPSPSPPAPPACHRRQHRVEHAGRERQDLAALAALSIAFMPKIDFWRGKFTGNVTQSR